jgi:lysophospholipase L1-like esterase
MHRERYSGLARGVRAAQRWMAAALVALFVVAIAVASCGGPAKARPAGGPLSILVVGDSISTGCSDVPVTGWCGRLSALLSARSIEHSIAGHTVAGQSCVTLSYGFAARFDQVQPDVVILNCGTNDAPLTASAQNLVGERWRTMTEYAWTHGAHVLPVFVQYSNEEINEENGRSWLLPGEGAANDVVYVNMQYYISAGWFVGLADLQRVPGDWNYLNGGTDGIHPNEFGQNVYAIIFYRAMRGFYGWPDTVPEPRGMWGHREIYGPPSYIPWEVAA